MIPMKRATILVRQATMASLGFGTLAQEFAQPSGDCWVFEARECRYHENGELYGYDTHCGRPVHIPLDAVEAILGGGFYGD